MDIVTHGITGLLVARSLLSGDRSSLMLRALGFTPRRSTSSSNLSSFSAFSGLFAGAFIGLVLVGLLRPLIALAMAPESVIVPVSEDNVQRLEIAVDSYSFTPNRFVVKENIPVELIFKSVTWIVPHNFVLKSPEAGITIEKEIGAGETTMVRFTPTRIGEFKFSCTKKLPFFPSHEDRGMVGSLIVRQ